MGNQNQFNAKALVNSIKLQTPNQIQEFSQLNLVRVLTLNFSK